MKEYVLMILGGIFIYFTPVLPLLFLVSVFIFSDTLLGLYTAKKLQKEITSRKLARIITKLIIYTSAILLIFLLDTLVFGMFIDTPFIITKLGAGVLCFIEVFSMDENIRKINKGRGIIHYITKSFDFIKNIKDKFNSSVNG